MQTHLAIRDTDNTDYTDQLDNTLWKMIYYICYKALDIN